MTLGQLLKNQRTQLGKSIEQISTSTRIHIKVLQALENDEYAHLPARAFTRGFIITYCKALKLNPDEILSSYHDFLESKFAERPEKDQGHQGYAFESRESEQNKKGMIIIASVAGLFAILTLLFFKPQNHKHREKHKELVVEETEEPVLPTPSVTSEKTSEINTVAVTAPSPTSSPAPSPSFHVAKDAVAVPTVATSPVPAVMAEASPSPSDPMNKGDLLKPNEIGVKVNFQAQEDVLVHYQSDQLPRSSLNLRKDKQLVIKATQKIHFETQNPEKLKFKLKNKKQTQTTYGDLQEKSLDFTAE